MNPFVGAIRYLGIFRGHLGNRLYVVLLLALIAGLMEGLGISLLLPLLATLELGLGAVGNVPGPLMWFVNTFSISGSLVWIPGLVAIMFLLKGMTLFVAGAYAGYLGAQLLKELKGKLFRACTCMSYAYYASRNTGHFVNVLNQQAGTFVGAFNSYVSFVIKTIQALVYVSFALMLAWQFGVMIIAIGVMLLLLFSRLNVYVRTLSRKTSSELSQLNKLHVQALQAFKYLVSTSGMSRLSRGVDRSVRRMTEYRVRQSIWAAFTGSITEPIVVALIIGSIVVQVIVFEQPFAPIMVAILFLYRAMSSIMQVQASWQTTLGSIGSVEMVETELAALNLYREPDGDQVIGPLRHGIAIKNVSYCYAMDLGNVLSNVTLSIPVHSTIAIVGESGAGKSTLIDLLTLLLKPQSGKVLIDGVPGTRIKLDSWRSQIGYVSQETVVFDDTIAANIALNDIDPTRDHEAMQAVRIAARKAHLADFIDSLPDNYMTVVGDRGIRLSGGQRQRLFIARELFKGPRLLILDEATSALDSESERAIQVSIDSLRGQLTVVIIAHRLSTISNVDRVYVLERGTVVEQGSFDGLRDQEQSRFSHLVAMQQL
ncbi:MAG: ABC transporter ATP-binding protein/permease [Gammaproteobacteria bacterium]|nr:ABC transporter ATP-binding protein/permease [Gammaproteobacteria bacterium]